MQAVIMAGGKGTRLASLTKDQIPKPMAPVLGRPILEWQMERLAENGVRDVILVVGHLGNVIRDYFGAGASRGVRIRYVEEREPLGTAGAFGFLRDMLDPGPFFLVFGDVIFDIDMARMAAWHTARKARATLFVHPNAHPFDSDLVIPGEDGKVLRFDSKSNVRDYWYDNCVNAGFYVLDSSVCALVPRPVKTDLEKEVLGRLVREDGGVYAYRSPEYIKDVGTVERIRKASEDLESGLAAARNLRREQRAVFLDRDGTINRGRGLVFREDQFELEAGAVEAVRRINDSGRLAIVITNQPVVARGLCGVADVENIHNKMKTLLGREGVFLDDVRFCPHHPDKGFPGENPAYKIPCRCRKPDIGMIEDCAARYNIDLGASWFVGDTTVDVRTGRNAGTRTALVLTGEAGRDGKYGDKPDLICENLLDAVEKILGE